MRQLLRPLVWLLVLFVGGTLESLRVLVRLFATLGFKGVLMIATLAVLWRSDSLPRLPLPASEVGPLGHTIAYTGVVGVMAAVALCGLLSPMRRRLWRQLRRLV
jgi:hypothetical protein